MCKIITPFTFICTLYVCARFVIVSLPYELHTDASGDALGAVLYQEQEGMKSVIAMPVED